MSALALGLKLSAIKTLSAVQRAINILKSAGPGAWYDPSDLTTLFQDSAGTTPVTAVEQPVGRILDKSGGGNHLIQPTATSRPTLSSRYNLLTKTEQFDDAAWAKLNVANTTGKVSETAVTGVFLSYQSVMPGGGTYTLSVEAKAAERSRVALEFASVYPEAVFNLSTGTVQSSASCTPAITALADGWYRCSITATLASVSTSVVGIRNDAGSRSYAGTAGNGVFVRMSSLVVSTDAALPYQRVNTATDYDFDFSKFPPYLKFDGVDDSLYSAASVDFTSTDKMTVFAGVHKANTSPGIVIEASALSDTTDGSFSYVVGGWADTREYFSTRGTVNRFPIFTVAPPATSVLSAASDISGDLIAVRANGVQVINSPGDLGTGNFGNYPLYIGRRNNDSFPFSGRIYQLAIKGKAMTAAEISTLESYINSKTKAF